MSCVGVPVTFKLPLTGGPWGLSVRKRLPDGKNEDDASPYHDGRMKLDVRGGSGGPDYDVDAYVCFQILPVGLSSVGHSSSIPPGKVLCFPNF